MEKWFGSAGVCVNEYGELLMVLQGKPEEEKTWTVPSGGREENENYQACCTREIKEETGYEVEIIEVIKVKKDVYKEVNIAIEVHYYSVKIVGGERRIQDPDQLIYDIAWKSIEELEELNLSFPEDRGFLIDCIRSNYGKGQLGEKEKQCR